MAALALIVALTALAFVALGALGGLTGIALLRWWDERRRIARRLRSIGR